MAIIETRIRFADNAQELANNLKQGLDQIEALKKSADRLTSSMGGDGLFRAANNLTAAITQLGGATKLTEAEQVRASATLDKAIAKYTSMGQTAPTAMRALSDELRPQPGLLDNISSKLGPLAAGFGLAFGATAIIGGIVSFGKGVLADADALEKLHDKTGISEEGLQRFQIVGDEAGNTLEEMTSAVTKFQYNLVEGKADDALMRIGIRIQDIKDKKPDEQFLMIGAALEKIEDPAQRADLAITLFGKSGVAVLPSLLHASADLKDGVNVMSAENVQALDAIGDAWTRAWRAAKLYGAQALINAAGPHNTQSTVDELLKLPGLSDAQRADLTKQSSTPGMVVGQALSPEQLAAVAAPMLALNAAGKALTMTNEAAADAEKILNAEIARTIPVNTAAAAAAKKLAEEHKKLMASIREVEHSTRDSIYTFKDWEAVGTHVDVRMETLAETVERLQRGGLMMSAYWEKVGVTMGTLPNVVPKATQDIKDATAATKTLGESISDDLAKGLTEASGSLARAFESGGSILKGIESLGVKAGSLLGTTIGKTFKSLGKFGGPIGDAIGSLAGPLISMLAGLGGPSAAELAGRDAATSFTSGFDTTLSQAPPGATQLAKDLSALQQSYIELGYSSGDAAAMAQAKWNAMQGATTQGAAAVTAAGLIITNDMAAAAKAASSVSTAVAGVTTAAGTLGVKMPQAIKDSIAALLTMKGLTTDEIEALNNLTKSAAPDFAQLTTMAAGYGITLEGLGPKFQQANIDGTAKQIMNDFTALTDAGADAGGVTLGMSDKILQLVEDSRKFGTAIPDNMKPLIQSMEDSTVLSEDFKKSLGSMADMTFEATPLDQGLKGLQDALNNLTDTLKGLPGVATAAADGMTTAFGGQVNRGGATILQFPQRGSALSSDSLAGMSSGGATGGGGATVNIPVYLDGRNITTVVAKLLPAELKRVGAIA